MKFIETKTENGTTIIFNVASIRTVLKDNEGKAIITLDNANPFKTELDYEELKNELIQSNDSKYSDSKVDFSC